MHALEDNMKAGNQRWAVKMAEGAKAYEERFEEFARNAMQTHEQASEQGRAMAAEERSTAADTGACSSNGHVIVPEAYII